MATPAQRSVVNEVNAGLRAAQRARELSGLLECTQVCKSCSGKIDTINEADFVESVNHGSRFGGTTKHLIHNREDCRASAINQIVSIADRYSRMARR